MLLYEDAKIMEAAIGTEATIVLDRIFERKASERAAIRRDAALRRDAAIRKAAILWDATSHGIRDPAIREAAIREKAAIWQDAAIRNE
jgi:hypothetical protein